MRMGLMIMGLVIFYLGMKRVNYSDTMKHSNSELLLLLSIPDVYSFRIDVMDTRLIFFRVILFHSWIITAL